MIRFLAARTQVVDALAEFRHGPVRVVEGGRTKSEALDRFAEALRFPQWGGRNLDALYELLDEDGHQATEDGGGWTLLWAPSADLPGAHPADYARIVDVLADVAATGRSRQILVIGPDPSAARTPTPTFTDGALVRENPTRSVSILGSTGSIGTQALAVIAEHPGRYTVAALAAGRNLALTAEQAVSTRAPLVALADGDAHDLRDAIHAAARAAGLASGAYSPEIVVGEDAAEVAAGVGADVVLNGITGAIGLRPTLAALGTGSTLALANKESLIVGGPLVRAAARPDQIVPVDSEHSAIAQSLRGGRREEVRRLVVTASGGPFRGRRRAELAHVTPAEALAHPNYAMGRVITTNSATLVNKGLEVIEAHLLFDIPFDRIDVVVHPQQWIHSMVEFHDGSTIAQMGPPRMLVPIALGLSWPERLSDVDEPCDWSVQQRWDFEPLDDDAFPAVRLARQVGQAGGTYPAVYNAANEVCVDAFHAGTIGFLDIVDTVARVVEAYADSGSETEVSSVEQVLAADTWARRSAADHIGAGLDHGSPSRESEHP